MSRIVDDLIKEHPQTHLGHAAFKLEKLSPDEIDCIIHALAQYTSGVKMRRIVDKLEAINAGI